MPTFWRGHGFHATFDRSGLPCFSGVARSIDFSNGLNSLITVLSNISLSSCELLFFCLLLLSVASSVLSETTCKEKEACAQYLTSLTLACNGGYERFDRDGYRFPVEGGFNYELRCHYCEKVFRSYSFRRFYCSTSCQHSTWKLRRRERARQRRNKVCLFCKLPFTAKSSKARFCSLKHRVAYFRLKKRNDSTLGSIDTTAKTLHSLEEDC